MAYEWNPYFQYLKRENAVEILMKNLRHRRKEVRIKKDKKIITNGDVIRDCKDCWRYRGCEDCALCGTEYCDGEVD